MAFSKCASVLPLFLFCSSFSILKYGNLFKYLIWFEDACVALVIVNRLTCLDEYIHVYHYSSGYHVTCKKGVYRDSPKGCYAHKCDCDIFRLRSCR